MNDNFNIEIKKVISARTPTENQLIPGEEKHRKIHLHWFREILVVLSGHSEFVLNNGIYQADPGTVFMIGRKVPHAYEYEVSDHDLKHLWISYECGIIFGCMVYVHSGGKDLSWGKGVVMGADAWHLISERWDLLERGKLQPEAEIFNCLHIPLLALIDDYRFNVKYRVRNPSINKIRPVVDILLHHIKTNRGRNCSWPELEQVTGYTRYYLAHQFKKNCGFSVREYINQIRIESAAIGFSQGAKQKELADDLGFASAVSFWNWLRKHKDQVKKRRESLDTNLNYGK